MAQHERTAPHYCSAPTRFCVWTILYFSITIHPWIRTRQLCTAGKGGSSVFCTKKEGYLGVCQATQRVESTGERLRCYDRKHCAGTPCDALGTRALHAAPLPRRFSSHAQEAVERPGHHRRGSYSTTRSSRPPNLSAAWSSPSLVYPPRGEDAGPTGRLSWPLTGFRNTSSWSAELLPPLHPHLSCSLGPLYWLI